MATDGNVSKKFGIPDEDAGHEYISQYKGLGYKATRAEARGSGHMKSRNASFF